MKRHICYLLLSPLIFSIIGCNGNKAGTHVDVVVISGQSNAVGCTFSYYIPDALGEERYTNFLNGYDSIKIAYDCWTKDVATDGTSTFYSQNTSRGNTFVNVKLGQGNSVNTFGPEIGIAEALHEKYSNKLFLIKYACGASNLKDDWTTRKSPMYGRFIDYIRLQIDNLVKQGYAPTIKAFCWMQGEGDSYSSTYYGCYQDNLRTFVSNVREDLKDLTGNKELPFIDAGISLASVWPYPEKVNEAKAAFATESENNYYIDTVAAGLHTEQEPTPPATPDECHYDSESQVQLGHLFAEAFEPFLQ